MDIDAIAIFRGKPLYAAMLVRELRMVQSLLDSAVNETDRQGRTPLMIAPTPQNLQMVVALLAAGADPNVNRSSGAHIVFLCQLKVNFFN